MPALDTGPSFKFFLVFQLERGSRLNVIAGVRVAARRFRRDADIAELALELFGVFCDRSVRRGSSWC